MMYIEIIKTQRFKFINYCPVVVDTENKTCIFIDPSWEKRKFQNFVTRNELRVVAILLTHHHLDHSHLANYFAKYYECPVFMSSSEIEYYGFQCHNLKAIYPFQNLLNLEHLPSIIIHQTPGHTFGGLCFQIDNVLFTGDTLFNEGCGFCHSKGGDAGMMFDSLNYLKKMIPDEVLVYPGHRYHHDLGQCFSEVKKMNIYLNIEDRNDFIQFRTRKTKGLLNFR
ncbi:MBL fold metallo-hydrolase [Legionella sp. PC997]|uniref:MBL fold metallo-hydrolase n=1 Tax=Legionella sp. PC997 TaxID=2755562 RepID=UPI0021067F28|nr:MBL fold metallo-hydrolase [Legionella sp. PC997]